MAKRETWALVSNGVRGRILMGLEDGNASLPVERISKSRARYLRDSIGGRAGRSFASDRRGRRSAMEPPSDPVSLDMHEFAQETLNFLQDRHRSGEFERLAIIAGPKMMGILREEMPSALRSTVILEHVANLMWLSEHQLKETVMEILRKG